MTIEDAASVLRSGMPLIFPTDTVMGIGVAVEYSDGPHSLVKLKGRSKGKPIAWLVGSAIDLDRYGANVPDYAKALAEELWPGALTIVVEASDDVPEPYRAADGTVGLRMPASEVACELIGSVGCPIATTSANYSGNPAPSSYSELDPKLAEGSYVLLVSEDGDMEGAGADTDASASTVVDCTDSAPKILRAGTIPTSDIERIASKCEGTDTICA